MEYSRVDGVKVMEVKGPWKTKSEGQLNVLLALDLDMLKDSFVGSPGKINRGLRIYTVRNLPKDKIGGKEFHKEREEIIFSLEGEVLLTCEDVFGGKREMVLDNTQGIWVRPFILHTYKSLKENSGLLVVANTLFDPNDKSTHDTYSKEEFQKLKES